MAHWTGQLVTHVISTFSTIFGHIDRITGHLGAINADILGMNQRLIQAEQTVQELRIANQALHTDLRNMDETMATLIDDFHDLQSQFREHLTSTASYVSDELALQLVRRLSTSKVEKKRRS